MELESSHDQPDNSFLTKIKILLQFVTVFFFLNLVGIKIRNKYYFKATIELRCS